MAIDNTIKRENLVENMVIATRQLLDALDKLAQLKEEYTQLDPQMGNDDFFTRPSIQHLNGYLVNYDLTEIIPALQAVLNANSGLYNNILFKVK